MDDSVTHTGTKRPIAETTFMLDQGLTTVLSERKNMYLGQKVYVKGSSTTVNPTYCLQQESCHILYVMVQA